jgi:hypothetical protein
MDPCLPDFGFLEEGMPVLPVISGVDWRTGRRAEDQVPVLPGRAGGEALGGLLASVGAQLCQQRCIPLTLK